MPDDEPKFEIKVSQVTLNHLLTKDGTPIGSCVVQLRPCCPPRISSEFGLTASELLMVLEDANDLRGYLEWLPEEPE